MGRTVTFTPKVRRQRKMTILLTPKQSPRRHVTLHAEKVDDATTRNVPPPIRPPADMGLSSLADVCHRNWSRWCKLVHQERLRCLEETSQYPTGANIAALMDTETLQHRMDHVRIILIGTFVPLTIILKAEVLLEGVTSFQSLVQAFKEADVSLMTFQTHLDSNKPFSGQSPKSRLIFFLVGPGAFNFGTPFLFGAFSEL